MSGERLGPAAKRDATPTNVADRDGRIADHQMEVRDRTGHDRPHPIMAEPTNNNAGTDDSGSPDSRSFTDECRERGFVRLRGTGPFEIRCGCPWVPVVLNTT